MNVTIRTPSKGRTVAVVGDVYRFLATGEDTNGKYALWEALVPPGGGPPPHVHSREEEGFYVLEVISGSGELMKEIDRRLKVTEGLLRHLIVRVDESTIKAERARTKRTEESRRRRVARGLPPDRQPGEGPQTDDADDSGDDYMEVEA